MSQRGRQFAQRRDRVLHRGAVARHLVVESQGGHAGGRQGRKKHSAAIQRCLLGLEGATHGEYVAPNLAVSPARDVRLVAFEGRDGSLEGPCRRLLCADSLHGLVRQYPVAIGVEVQREAYEVLQLFERSVWGEAVSAGLYLKPRPASRGDGVLVVRVYFNGSENAPRVRQIQEVPSFGS